jgi:hypothetical protein
MFRLLAYDDKVELFVYESANNGAMYVPIHKDSTPLFVIEPGYKKCGILSMISLTTWHGVLRRSAKEASRRPVALV